MLVRRTLRFFAAPLRLPPPSRTVSNAPHEPVNPLAAIKDGVLGQRRRDFDHRVCIVGNEIEALTCALALKRRSLVPTLLSVKQAINDDELVFLHTNALSVFQFLNVLPQIMKHALPVLALERFRSETERPAPLGRTAFTGASNPTRLYYVPKTILTEVLTEAVFDSALGPVPIVQGVKEIANITQIPLQDDVRSVVRVEYMTLSDISENEEFDCLVGADGPNSIVRNIFWAPGERSIAHEACRFSFLFPLPEGLQVAELSVNVLREEFYSYGVRRRLWMPHGGHVAAFFPLLPDEKSPTLPSTKSVSPDEYIARRGPFVDHFDEQVAHFATKHGLSFTKDYTAQYSVPTPSYNAIVLIGTSADSFIPSAEGIELPLRLKDAIFIAELIADREFDLLFALAIFKEHRERHLAFYHKYAGGLWSRVLQDKAKQNMLTKMLSWRTIHQSLSTRTLQYQENTLMVIPPAGGKGRTPPRS